MKIVEMEIGTFYFLPYRMGNPFGSGMIDCIIYQNYHLAFIDSCSYFVKLGNGMKSLRKIAYPYEEDEEVENETTQ